MKIIPTSIQIKHYPIGELHITKGFTPSGKEVTEFKEYLHKKLSARATIIKGEGSILEHFDDRGKITKRFINKFS